MVPTRKEHPKKLHSIVTLPALSRILDSARIDGSENALAYKVLITTLKGVIV